MSGEHGFIMIEIGVGLIFIFDFGDFKFDFLNLLIERLEFDFHNELLLVFILLRLIGIIRLSDLSILHLLLYH